VKQSIMKLNVQANVCGMVSHVLQRDVTTLQSKNYVLDPTTMKVALGHQDFVSDFPPVNSTITWQKTKLWTNLYARKQSS